MQAPALDDTIIAVSTGWQAAPLGIVRLSGPAAFELAAQVGVKLPADDTRPRVGWCDACLAVGEALTIPVTAIWFAAPHSYTRQDVLELHTVGSLPVLRAVSSHLIELGARRALPGEFTARAFLNGRLDADQVDSVLGLIHAQDQAAARQAARLSRGFHRTRLSALNERLTDLIAEVEAGIDFVEEEDVHFITPQELCAALDQLIEGLEATDRPARGVLHAGKPHVALAGLPNGGKSTLFNALLGYERAIVSPVLGTTRDVLSAAIEAGPITLVLQDCAGLGASTDELESAAHLAAEQAAAQADLVLWVHDCTTPWDAREAKVCIRIPEERRVLVVTKLDRARGHCDQPPPASFAATVHVSAISGVGLDQLGHVVAERLESLGSGRVGGVVTEHGTVLAGALKRAREIALQSEALVALPEVIALELRRAWEAFETLERGPLAEDVLGKILQRFCVGK